MVSKGPCRLHEPVSVGVSPGPPNDGTDRKVTPKQWPRLVMACDLKQIRPNRRRRRKCEKKMADWGGAHVPEISY